MKDVKKLKDKIIGLAEMNVEQVLEIAELEYKIIALVEEINRLNDLLLILGGLPHKQQSRLLSKKSEKLSASVSLLSIKTVLARSLTASLSVWNMAMRLLIWAVQKQF